MYSLSYDFLSKEKPNPFHLLMPLIKQSAKKIKTQKPAAVQTGPAKRGDTKNNKKAFSFIKKIP